MSINDVHDFARSESWLRMRGSRLAMTAGVVATVALMSACSSSAGGSSSATSSSSAGTNSATSSSSAGTSSATSSSPASSSSGAAVAGNSSLAKAEAWVQANVPGLPVSVVQQACQEGVLSLYSLIPPGIAEVNKKFSSDIPCVKVSAFQASGGALASRFTSEMQAGKHNADVIQNFSVGFLDSAVSSGWLANYTPPNAANVPSQWAHAGYWYGIGLDPMGIFWNTTSVTAAQQKQLSSIKTWDQVLGIPGLKGKTGVVDIQSGGTAQLPLYFLQQKYGLQFWSDLESQYDPTIFDSITPLSQRLASGSIAVGLDAETTVPGAALAQGAPLQWVYPTPTVGVPQMLGVVKDAPHVAAAELYMAWSLSTEGLTAWSADNLLAPISDAIPDNRSFVKDPWFVSPKSNQYYQANWTEITAALPALTTKFMSTFK